MSDARTSKECVRFQSVESVLKRKKNAKIFYISFHCVVMQLNNNCASLMTEQNVKLTFCAMKEGGGGKGDNRARVYVCVRSCVYACV